MFLHEADAVTVNAYMGRDAIQPFLSYRNKGTFVLVKTSNKSSDELQTLPVLSDTTQAADSAKAVPLYVQVATVCNDVARGKEMPTCPRRENLVEDGAVFSSSVKCSLETVLR